MPPFSVPNRVLMAGDEQLKEVEHFKYLAVFTKVTSGRIGLGTEKGREIFGDFRDVVLDQNRD